MLQNPVETAHRHARSGNIQAALVALQAARDDALACAELATWYMRGDIIPRDLALARKYLHRAAEIGHVGAAMVEIALTANGSGGEPDWPAAFALLRHAAKGDPVARQQLDLLERMDLDAQGFPNSPPTAEILDETLPVLRYANFLTPSECEHIARATAHLLEPSTVFDPRTGRQIANPIRDSHGAVIAPTEEDLVIQAIERRIAGITCTDVFSGESLSVLRYTTGQQYKLHYDTMNKSTNNRIKTVILYLNHGYTGGQTCFPKIPLTVTPRAGDAVVFDGVDESGAVHPLSLHAGLPVERGQKWIMTRWIRERRFDPWNYAGEG